MKKHLLSLAHLFALLLLVVGLNPALAQDDDEAVPARVLDAGNRPIGKAELIPDTATQVNFTYYIKMWLSDGRLRVIRLQSGSRSSGIQASFREYKYDASRPKDSSRWDETGSGTASLQMPATGDVQKITLTMTRTKKVSGDDEVAVDEPAQKFDLVLE